MYLTAVSGELFGESMEITEPSREKRFSRDGSNKYMKEAVLYY
jgi:hypothetical protein